MFRKGGSANEGIMHGLERKGYDQGTNWEDLAKAYNISGSERFSGESDLYKNIDPSLINTGEGGYGTNLFKSLHDKGADEPSTLIQSIFEEAAEAKKYPDLSETKMEEGPPGGTQLPYVKPRKKDDGGIDGLSTNDARAIIADKKSMLSDRAKEFAELLSPGAQKRAIYDSLAAESEAFGKGTGNTRQYIANAITAAAKGMGGATDTYEKARLLAIEEDIKKGIAEASYKPTNTESLINFYRGITDKKGNRQYSESDIAGILTSKKGENLDITDFLRSTTTAKQGHIEHARWQQRNNPDFAGILPENKKGEIDIEEAKKTMVEGKIYFDQSKRMYVEKVIKDGVVKIIPAAS